MRLHISPFSPDLLSSYLTAEQQTLACDVSYHNIQTFPEKNFGYVTLPTMEAQKVKKKFNGATLRGSRVRVQEARPEKLEVDHDEPPKESSGKKRRNKSTEHGVLPGFELPTDRSVKRGWTDPDARPATRSRKDRKGQDDDKPKQQPSKYTKNPELLFRAKLPPTAELPTASKSKAKKKSKRHSAGDVVVHEFENTQQFPAFLNSTHVDRKSKISRRFVEGEGWLDEDGICIEEDTSSRPKPPKPPAEPDNQSVVLLTTVKKKDKRKRKQSPPRDVPVESEARGPGSVKAADAPPTTTEVRPKRASSRKQKPPALELKLSQDDEMPDAGALDMKDAPDDVNSNSAPHPLEALYKRPRSELSAAANEPFTFFGSEEVDEVPQDLGANSSPHFGTRTPKSRAEPRWTRSGAPTPDTAYGRRRFSFSRGVIDVDDRLDEEDEDGDDEEMEAKAEPKAGDIGASDDGDEKDEAPKEQSAFEKWFWENRGANNRAWKKRRREALREVRRRESKRLSKKAL